ncbi:MAG: winged helix DNA-binding domain-containing protein [Saprospiraceae bacterium]
MPNLSLPAIAQLRLQNQQIAGTKFHTPEEVVAWHGAMQAQEYSSAKWAVGLRLPPATDETMEAAIATGTILRTHLLRPTWHLVAAADIRWMMALTAPQIRAQSGARHRELGLDAPLLKRSNDLIARALEGGKHLTRAELAEVIAQAGIPVDASRMVYFMFSAELDAVVCNGLRRGKEHTYALLHERVPAGHVPTKEEALAELARRFFISHAPASLPDFTWWSGLRVGDARQALEAIKSELESQPVGSIAYWMPKGTEIPEKVLPAEHLLPAFDEYLVSYKDRSAILDTAQTSQVITSNGIFKPLIVVDGRVAGIWSRMEKKHHLILSKQLFIPLSARQESGILKAAERYGRFLGKAVLVG